jgi:hypothetical protein
MKLGTQLRLKENVNISRKIIWSQLAKVGKVPAMRLTVLIPFIGVFLLFNEQTEKLFQFPDFFMEDIGATEGSKLPASNQYFTYFGLCFLGIASAVFAILCPREISNQPSQQAFVLEATSLETPVLAKDVFERFLINTSKMYQMNTIMKTQNILTISRGIFMRSWRICTHNT